MFGWTGLKSVSQKAVHAAKKALDKTPDSGIIIKKAVGKSITEVQRNILKGEPNSKVNKKGYSLNDFAENERHSMIEDICEQLGVEYKRWKKN